jgi:hypothetical protein
MATAGAASPCLKPVAPMNLVASARRGLPEDVGGIDRMIRRLAAIAPRKSTRRNASLRLRSKKLLSCNSFDGSSECGDPRTCRQTRSVRRC